MSAGWQAVGGAFLCKLPSGLCSFCSAPPAYERTSLRYPLAYQRWPLTGVIRCRLKLPQERRGQVAIGGRQRRWVDRMPLLEPLDHGRRLLALGSGVGLVGDYVAADALQKALRQ